MDEKRKESEMENELVPNNTTLAGLRGLLRAAKKNTPPEEAICIELEMWHYDEPPTGSGALKESIGVYRSGNGKGTCYSNNLKDARKEINSWKEKENGNDT